jgi:hypothetical protein
MRIIGLGSSGVGGLDPRKREPVGPVPRAEGTEPVRLAAGSRRVLAAVARDEASSADRVAAVRAALANGTYTVDLDRLAERIADEELARSKG